MNSKFTVKTYISIILLSLSGASIYLLPYLRWSYYDAVMDASGLNNTQFGITMSIYGIFAMIFYTPGGWLADKFSAKKLLSISLLGTGILGFWFASFPGYAAQIIIYALWGILATLTFWAALMKATRRLGAEEVQGRLFGFVEGGRGILTTIISFAALFVFKKMGEGLGGLKGIVLIMSAINVIAAILVWFVLEEGESVKEEEKQKASAADIIAILKMPSVWLISLIIVCCYSVYLGSTYLTPYFTNVIGATASLAALLSIMRTYICQFICGPAGGVIADKIKSITKVIIGCYVIMLAALVVIIMLPASPKVMVPLVVTLIILCSGIFAMRGIYFATVGEVGIPIHVAGTAVGIVSVIGFLPDAFMSALCGGILDRYEGASGYRAIFILMLAFAAVGFLAAVILLKISRKKLLKQVDK